MKNRKAPVMLFGVVVVAVAGMAVFNAASQNQNPQAMQQNQEEAVKEHTPTGEEVKKTVQSAINKLPETPGQSTPKAGANGKKLVSLDDAPGQSMEMSSEPTIMIEEYTPIPPKPNDSGTATHWYDDESRSSKLAAENQKSRG